MTPELSTPRVMDSHMKEYAKIMFFLLIFLIAKTFKITGKGRFNQCFRVRLPNVVEINNVLSWLCLALLDYIALYSIVLYLTLVQNVTYNPFLIWQSWTKYWTKVVINGNFVHTKVMYKGITNRST